MSSGTLARAPSLHILSCLFAHAGLIPRNHQSRFSLNTQTSHQISRSQHAEQADPRPCGHLGHGSGRDFDHCACEVPRQACLASSSLLMFDAAHDLGYACRYLPCRRPYRRTRRDLDHRKLVVVYVWRPLRSNIHFSSSSMALLLLPTRLGLPRRRRELRP